MIMNKKFSTLLVSMLLAGGLFSANAQTQVWPNRVAGNGFYHVLKVHGSDATVPYLSSFSVSLENGALVQEQDLDEVSKSNAWTVTEVKVNGAVIGYEFTNANGSKLQFDANGDYTAKASDAVYSVFKFDGPILKAVDGAGSYISGKFLTQTGNGYALGTGTNTLMYTLPIYSQNAGELNQYLEDGFAITIGKTKVDKDHDKADLQWDGAYEDLDGNVFAGKLSATSSANGVILKNEAGKTIVLTSDKWGNLNNDLQTGAKTGYKFAAMTDAQITAARADGKILDTEFVFTQPNEFTTEPLEVKTAGGYELMVAAVDGNYYLTTGDAADRENDDTQLVGTASFTNNGVWGVNAPSENTYVKFGLDNLADYSVFNDAVWNITQTEYDANGKVVETLVAGPSCDPQFAWVPAEQVALAYPEGQWLWNGSAFVNRESGRYQTLNGLRVIEGEELTFSKGNFTYTFVKVGEPSTNYTDGYLSKYTNDDLLQKAFRIATPVKATGDTVYLAKDEDGALFLSDDIVEAVAFRLERNIFSNNAGNKHSQEVRHYTTYASDKTTSGFADDILNMSQYIVTEATTGDALAYDSRAQKFILSDQNGWYPLTFKNKAEGLYNIVENLNTSDDNKDGDVNKYQGELFDAFCNAYKLYGAHNTAELKQADRAYAYVANDLFILEEVGAEQHVSNIEGDTVKIFREADHNYFLFENEGFLDLKNFLDPAYKNAALYVDSAAGKNTWRQEYLLAVGVHEHKDGMMCPFNPLHNDQTWRDEHNNGKPCADAVKVKDFKTGRYLVNLVDSAKAQTEAGVKDAQNKFMFQNYVTSEPYYRLGFVPATHVEDSLIIASTNDTIIVSNNSFGQAKVCDFAFHYVDADRTSFIIETAYDYEEWIDDLTEEVKYEARKGYIKYHNGIPVVTPKVEEAEVFTLEQTSEDPTDNETIATSEVKVLAGNGNVTIAGAAGKKVVISNILGQVVANTVISSDNATIAAPAGVVVVAVEGEAAVKAIVK